MFWTYTPFEIGLLIESYNERMKYESDERITQAYLTAYWNRVQEMPSLKEVLGIKEDEDELLNYIKALNAKLGGEVF